MAGRGRRTGGGPLAKRERLRGANLVRPVVASSPLTLSGVTERPNRNGLVFEFAFKGLVELPKFDPIA